MCTRRESLHPDSFLQALTAATKLVEQDATVLDLTDRQGVTVVGDIHGCGASLHRVLSLSAPPSTSHALVFNGDFVDRGHEGAEVLASLALLKCCHPTGVVLLRGNHEDELLATAYGFKDELFDKYPQHAPTLWAAATRLFAALPVAAVTADSFIVHGGLPHERLTIESLAQVSGTQRAIASVLPSGDVRDADGAASSEERTTAALLQGLLWSDPSDIIGVVANHARGAGALFGEDVALDFLRRHGLRYLVRSHQVVEEGWERVVLCAPPHGDAFTGHASGEELYTVFSAAAYPAGQGFNRGAILHLAEGQPPRPVVYDLTDESSELSPPIDARKQLADTHASLGRLIASHSGRLREAFVSHLAPSSGQGAARHQPADNRVTVGSWAAVLRDTLRLNIDWEALQPSIAPTVKRAAVRTGRHEANNGGDFQLVDTGMIDFERFLSSPLVSASANGASALEAEPSEQLYRSLDSLRRVVAMLDTNSDGVVDRSEFVHGFRMLNSRLPADQQVAGDPNQLFDVIDSDGSGSITFAELCEAFRLTVGRG